MKARIITPKPYLTQSGELEFADKLLLKQKKEPEVTFLVPSPYELVLLRILRNIREGKIKSNELNVEILTKNIGTIEVRVDEEGEFLDVWPEGFFEARVKELF